MRGVRDIKVFAGQDFKIPVPIKGYPPPTVKWELNDKDLEKNPRRTEEVRFSI